METQNIAIDLLIPYDNQPFKPLSETKMQEIRESINDVGLINPIIVRKLDNNYQILSGHNRVNVFKQMKKTEIPATIHEICSDDDAKIIITDSNLRQREKILPLEYARAYKMQYEVLKQQGKRNDLTSHHNEERLTAAQKVANKNNTSKSNVERHLLLLKLVAKLQTAVDEKTLPLLSGVELSHIHPKKQNALYQYFFKDKKIKITTRIAKRLRSELEYEESEFNADLAEKILRCINKRPPAINVLIETTLFKNIVLPKENELSELITDLLMEHFKCK